MFMRPNPITDGPITDDLEAWLPGATRRWIAWFTLWSAVGVLGLLPEAQQPVYAQANKSDASDGGRDKSEAEATGKQEKSAPARENPEAKADDSKRTPASGQAAKRGANQEGRAGRAGSAQAQQGHEKRVGRLIRISSPITDKVDNRVKRVVSTAIQSAKENGEWPVLIFEIQPGKSQFGQAFDLAHYLSGPNLNGATTVAYIPETISGHAVLVAMACDEIIMGEDAEIGDAGASEPVIKPSMRDAYVEIANARKTIPSDVALKMLDPDIELLLVETDVSREFVRGDRLEELKQKKSFGKPKVVIPAGKPGVFTGGQAREYGFASFLAGDRQAAAKALSLPAKAVDEDFMLDGQLRPVRVAVKGPISKALAEQLQNLINSQIRSNEVNLICLWIDSPGGSPDDSINLANFLEGLDSSERRTVAYIPNEARGDAAFIALACDHIVMHPGAIIGGSGAFQINPDDIPAAARSVAAIAEEKHHSPALAEAMVDPKLVVYKYVRQSDGLVEYLTEREAEELPDADEWQRGEVVTGHGEPLQLTGEEAEQLGLLHGLVDNFNGFKALYGLENDPTLLEPGWADFLIDALNSPGVSWFLLLLGGAALYAELQSPGIGLGALVAGLCFMLYFWSAYLGGTAGWLEVLMFVAGLACLAVEVFVLPGFGLFGLAGGLLVIGSLILASQTFVLPRNPYQLAHLRNSLFVLAGAGLGTVVAAALIRHFLPHAPMFNRMLLAPPSHEELSALAEREAMARFDHLVGRRGTAFTPLVPSGKARIDEELIDVLTEGEFVDRGQSIEVIAVRGHRVLVRALG
ncbi:MAG TPA: NfeD family protein [Pirellulales bacterium]|nr:NfeD family protein [Pirellulales bacterium]